ncbi:MAG: renalase [Actinomycetota bacterium]|nr:renalase [Actinomycetota bacterium]
MTHAADSAAALVVGGGISGMSAAAACGQWAEGSPVVVLDRGRRIGGRMAARTLRDGPWAGHVVDLGAAYFTVSHPDFATVVDDWRDRGLVRSWTDTFAVAGPDGVTGHSTGPMRYASPTGLRSLVEDLATQAEVQVRHPVEATTVTAVEGGWRVNHIVTGDGSGAAPGRVADRAPLLALCLPAPQAIELLATPVPTAMLSAARDPRVEELESLWQAATAIAYEPILALVAQWPERTWDDFAGCFVNDDDVLSFVADDGDRRGDGAAVLVAHSTPEFAARHLLDPAGATTEMVQSLCRILRLSPPSAAQVKRWAVARPAATSPQARDAALASAGSDSPVDDGGFLLGASGTVGLASDAFDARPRVEAAWLSGRALGMALGSAAYTA